MDGVKLVQPRVNLVLLDPPFNKSWKREDGRATQDKFGADDAQETVLCCKQIC